MGKLSETKLGMVTKMGYGVLEILGDEVDTLEELETSEHNYICDAISEIADYYCPIYNFDIWKNVQDIQEWIEEAILEGIADAKNGLDNVFQCGYYLYYQSVMSENLSKVAYNVLVDYVNDELEVLLEEYEENNEIKIDFELLDEEIESLIDDYSDDFDHNDSWEDLKNEFFDMIISDYEMDEEE